MILLFGDVIFSRASLAPIDYDHVLADPGPSIPRTINWLPERHGRTVVDGQGDIGSAAWQFEPGAKFMAFCLRHGESPFWDPYTATGSLGPETLADLKFSPFSLAVAILGGGSESFCYVLLALFFLACYCLLRVCCVEMRLSTAAAFAACCLYFLNGFALTSLYSQAGQPYFLAPLLLRSLLLFTAKPRASYAALALVAHIAFISTTFFPTAVLAAIVVYSVSLGLRLNENPGSWRQLFLIHLAFPCAALLCLAFLYIPIFASQLGYLDTMRQYGARLTPGYSLLNLLSLFTPKHFWESYRAMSLPAGSPPGPYQMFVNHIGIVGPLLAVYAYLTKKGLRVVVVLLTICLLCSLGQMFGVFPFTLIDKLPFFRFVQNEYWACMSSLALVFLGAIGVDSIRQGRRFSYLALLVISIVACSFFYLLGMIGLPPDALTHKYLGVLLAIVAAAVSLLLLAQIPQVTRYAKVALTILLLAEGLFYMNNMQPYRSRRDERLPPIFTWLKTAVINHPGARVLNVGVTGLFPNWGSALQISELGNLNTCELPWYRAYYNTYIGVGLFMSLAQSNQTFLFTDESLSLAGVRYIMVDRFIQPALLRLEQLKYPVVREDRIRVIFENPNPQPRGFAVPAVRSAPGLPSDAQCSIRKIGLTTDEALLADARDLGVSRLDKGPCIGLPESRPGSVEVKEYRHTRVTLRAVMQRPGVVVLADSWSPNWKATLDGKAIHVAKVDVAFRGIAVPAGTHQIVFRYENRAIVIGVFISVLSSLVFVAILYYWEACCALLVHRHTANLLHL